MTRTCLLGLTLATICLTSPLSAEVTAERQKDDVTIKIDGKLFARYVAKSGAKPIIWPVVGPTGQEMTRGYPMRDAIKHEKEDHIHHRSFWFTHGDVNGVSFWHENASHGNIVQRDLKVEQNDKGVVLRSKNDWIGPDGKKHCEDTREFRFAGNDKQRWIDAEITVTASEGAVKFGDTKEGCFGVRVAGSMRTELGKGGKILTSEGQTDKEAWGKAAAWVDYFGPVNDETVGVAILNHPSSFRFPTYWHVRTYGLFAANPFGLHNFKGKQFDGSHAMKKGDSFTLRYRVLFHTGDSTEGRVAEAYKAYAAQKLD